MYDYQEQDEMFADLRDLNMPTHKKIKYLEKAANFHYLSLNAKNYISENAITQRYTPNSHVKIDKLNSLDFIFIFKGSATVKLKEISTQNYGKISYLKLNSGDHIDQSDLRNDHR